MLYQKTLVKVGGRPNSLHETWEDEPLLPLYLQNPTIFSIECICAEYFECKKASGTTNECR